MAARIHQEPRPRFDLNPVASIGAWQVMVADFSAAGFLSCNNNNNRKKSKTRKTQTNMKSNSMKRSVLAAGLLAALCALSASSALGSFSVTRGPNLARGIRLLLWQHRNHHGDNAQQFRVVDLQFLLIAWRHRHY